MNATNWTHPALSSFMKNDFVNVVIGNAKKKKKKKRKPRKVTEGPTSESRELGVHQKIQEGLRARRGARRGVRGEGAL